MLFTKRASRTAAQNHNHDTLDLWTCAGFLGILDASTLLLSLPPAQATTESHRMALRDSLIEPPSSSGRRIGPHNLLLASLGIHLTSALPAAIGLTRGSRSADDVVVSLWFVDETHDASCISACLSHIVFPLSAFRFPLSPAWFLPSTHSCKLGHACLLLITVLSQSWVCGGAVTHEDASESLHAQMFPCYDVEGVAQWNTES